MKVIVVLVFGIIKSQFGAIVLPFFVKGENIKSEQFPRGTMTKFGNFSEVVKCTTFVDKTLMISEFFNVSRFREFHLFTYPHKFGRSTNLDMMKRFLDKYEKKNENHEERLLNYQLFRNSSGNLKISKLINNSDFYEKHFQAYRVINISFKNSDGKTLEKTLNGLRQSFRSCYEQNEWLSHTFYEPNEIPHIEWNERQSYWSKFSSWQQNGKNEITDGFVELPFLLNKLEPDSKIIWLIDDYDDPILNAVEYNFDVTPVLELIEKMFSKLFSSYDCNIHYALITGTLNIFDKAVKHWDFLDNHPFSRYFGFTENEVQQLLNKHNINEKQRNVLIQHYDGYFISGSTMQIYNPYSVVKYVHHHHHNAHYLSLNFWMEFDRFSNFKINLNRKCGKIIKNLLDLEYVTFYLKKSWNCNDLNKLRKTIHNANPSFNLTVGRVQVFLSYLFHKGFLSHGDEPDTYCLPNEEIKTYLRRWYPHEDESAVIIQEHELKLRLSPP